MAHDVFISYSSRDKLTADAVCALLEARGIRCWIAPRDILPGDSWAESIIDAIEGAKVMVLVFSSSANASVQIQREVERAVNKGLSVVPLRIENTAPSKTMEYFISTPHWLDAIDPPMEQHIEHLASSVRALLNRHPASGSVPAQPPNVLQAAPAVAATPVAPASVPDFTPDRPRPTGPWYARPPVLGAAVITLVVALAAAVFWRTSSVQPNAPAAHTGSATTGAATTDAATATKAHAPAAPPAANEVVPAPAPATRPEAPASPPSSPTAAPAQRGPAAKALRQTTRAEQPSGAGDESRALGELVINLESSLEAGTVVASLDDREVWRAPLGRNLKSNVFSAVRLHRPVEELERSLRVAPGVHRVSIALFDSGSVHRETGTITAQVSESNPVEIRARLVGRDQRLQLTTR